MRAHERENTMRENGIADPTYAKLSLFLPNIRLRSLGHNSPGRMWTYKNSPRTLGGCSFIYSIAHSGSSWNQHKKTNAMIWWAQGPQFDKLAENDLELLNLQQQKNESQNSRGSPRAKYIREDQKHDLAKRKIRGQRGRKKDGLRVVHSHRENGYFWQKYCRSLFEVVNRRVQMQSMGNSPTCPQRQIRNCTARNRLPNYQHQIPILD